MTTANEGAAGGASKLRFTTCSPEDTVSRGIALGRLLRKGVIVSLEGKLGSGKTWLAKGLIASIANVEPDVVVSPAFTLINEYSDGLGNRVAHIDFYRLDHLNDIDRSMFEEYLYDPDLRCVVEWGEKFLPSMCESYLRVHVSFEPLNDDCREFIVDTVGTDAQVLNAARDWIRECTQF